MVIVMHEDYIVGGGGEFLVSNLALHLSGKKIEKLDAAVKV